MRNLEENIPRVAVHSAWARRRRASKRGKGLRCILCSTRWGLGWDRVRKKTGQISSSSLYPQSRTVRVLYVSRQSSRRSCVGLCMPCKYIATLFSTRSCGRRKKKRDRRRGKTGEERIAVKFRGNFILSHFLYTSDPIRIACFCVHHVSVMPSQRCIISGSWDTAKCQKLRVKDSLPKHVQLICLGVKIYIKHMFIQYTVEREREREKIETWQLDF